MKQRIKGGLNDKRVPDMHGTVGMEGETSKIIVHLFRNGHEKAYIEWDLAHVLSFIGSASDM